MFIRNTIKVYRSRVEHDLGDKASDGKAVLDYLFGKWSEDSETNFMIREWVKDYYDRKPYHRLNMFWALPLTLLFSPFQYIFRGGIGWDTKSTFGRWILKVTGHLRNE
jgi:hypothetical protein